MIPIISPKKTDFIPFKITKNHLEANMLNKVN